MKTYDKIIFACDDDIQKRDRAIVELWDALYEEQRESPVIDKYRDFVKKTRTIYGIPSEETEEA
jgi:hypothetical protein